jgi:peptide/nickel transport system ATP-binding protein
MSDEKALYLHAKGVTKIFGSGNSQTVAVDHVDIDFYQGEVVSIVGESGSGKTTLAKMFLGLISVTEGDIYFQGKKRDISSHKKKTAYWKNIQAIFQDQFSSYNTFNKIDSVLLDCIKMRGDGKLPNEKKDRDHGGGLQLRQSKVRGIDQQISL